jgi:hypothetical protein
MNKSDGDAIKWAITKYWQEKTDEELARGLSIPLEEVITTREKLELYRNKKGAESLKEFMRSFLFEMSREDKTAFVKRLSPEFVVKMAEGMPATSGSLDIGIEPIKIDITHQLEKVYGPKKLEAGDYKVLEGGEEPRSVVRKEETTVFGGT